MGRRRVDGPVSTRGSVADDPLPQGTSFATPKPGPRRMGWVVPTALVAVLAVVSFWVYRAVRNPVGHGLGVHGIEFSDSRLDAVDLRLDAGRAARIRVEPADGIDVRIAVAVDDDTATAIAEVLIDRYPDELPTVLGRARDDRTPLTVDDVRAAFFVAVTDVFGEDRGRRAGNDPGCSSKRDATGRRRLRGHLVPLGPRRRLSDPRRHHPGVDRGGERRPPSES
ncbi:MAG: hypothetical protein R2705_17145 [Ilumatobacteraceae bacterium]